MICEKCNRQLPGDSEFCQYCGNKTRTNTVDKAVEDSTVDSKNALEEIFVIQAQNTIAEMEESKQGQQNMKGDADFGLIPENPIYILALESADGAEEYLKRLVTSNKEKITWARCGSISVEGVSGMVDIYETFLPSGDAYKTIYINMYGEKVSTAIPRGFMFVDKTSHMDVQQTQNGNESKISKLKQFISKHKKRIIIISAIVVALIVGIIILSIPLSNRNSYNELKTAMKNVNRDNYTQIAPMFDEFPSDYRDVDEIEIQYYQIKKNIDTIESATQNNRDCANLRAAYQELYNFNNTHHNWDLSEYLSSVNTGDFAKLYFGKEWSNSNYEFRWYGDGEDGWLVTNLPNDKDSGLDYYFYIDYGSDIHNPTKFGYQNKTNTSEKFLAYKINDVYFSNGQWTIENYCYSNSRIYTLH